MKFRGLIQACHFGPTLLVTSISLGFALHYWPALDAIAIAVSVLSGQLIVGWSNDLHDYQDDLSHNRSYKPLVSGLLSKKFLKQALFVTLPISFAINLVGPLGIKGGALYLLGIAFGVLYNFYFKYNFLSPLPYAVGFAALPSCIAISKNETPPTWMWLGGALFGMAAHFINVIKDMEADRSSGIGGLPQRLGRRGSIGAAALLIALGVLALHSAL